MSGQTAPLPGSKHVFTTLDGLRGIAAIAVAALHLGPVLGESMADAWLPRAYLAVDLFFMMSGVVIAHAYDGRLASGMTVGQFMRGRMIRLYPLYLAGTLLMILSVGNALTWGRAPQMWSPGSYTQSVVAALLMLPSYLGSLVGLYPFNPPSWSIFFEILINLAFAALFPYISNRRLIRIIILGGLGVAAMGLVGQSLNAGHNWQTFWGGIPRVCFSFPFGVLVYRLWSTGKLPSVHVPLWAIFVIAVAVLGVRLPEMWVPLYEVAVVILVFPPLVVVSLSNSGIGIGLCRFLATISYPIYMLHLTVFHFVWKLKDIFDLQSPIAVVLILLTTILISWLADKYFDRPVRIWLTQLLSPARVRSELG